MSGKNAVGAEGHRFQKRAITADYRRRVVVGGMVFVNSGYGRQGIMA